MKTIEKIKKKLKKLKPQLKEKFKVKEIGIFGSFVRKEERKRSDIDILVEFQVPVTLFEFMDLAEFLEKILGRKVDLVTKNALKPILRESILKEVIYL